MIPLDLFANCAANTTHLLWAGRWVEASRVYDERLGEWCWRLKSGRDAADWLLS